MSDAPKAKLLGLHEERVTIEERLADALARQRYAADSGAAAQAEQDAKRFLSDLDRTMTQIRAAEHRASPEARRWP